MAVSAALAAKAALLLTDEGVRKKVGRAIAMVMAPILLMLVFLFSLASGAAGHNVSAAQLCFEVGELPANVPEEYRTHIVEMRTSFETLDGVISSVCGEMEDGDTLDGIRVKAMFYALFFGEDQPSRWAVRRFVDCFAAYEERTRTVENEDGTTSEETYTVAIPIENLDSVWNRIAAAVNVPLTQEVRENADSIYGLIRYGWTGGTGLGGDVGGPVMSVDGFCSPLGAGWQARISSDFGYRICPYHGREFHSGLDLAAPSGAPIRAALAGRVIKSYYSSSYGNYTVIDHKNGMTTAYAHQSKRMVKVGDMVEVGEIIGLVGSTGNSTGPHLHFEVRVEGKLQDPKQYLP